MEVIMTNLTDLEKDVIFNGMGKNEYYDGGSICSVWSDSIADSCKVTKITQLPGVISSLVKKNLVVCDGNGHEATVTLTKEGHKILTGCNI